jgi:Protein of unknown function (DUF1360)
MWMLKLLYLSVAVGTISRTISRSKIFREVRWAITRRNHYLGSLVECPYCVSHWVSFFVAFVAPPIISNLFFDWFLAAMVLTGLSTVTVRYIDETYSNMPLQPTEAEYKEANDARDHH